MEACSLMHVLVLRVTPNNMTGVSTEDTLMEIFVKLTILPFPSRSPTWWDNLLISSKELRTYGKGCTQQIYSTSVRICVGNLQAKYDINHIET